MSDEAQSENESLTVDAKLTSLERQIVFLKLMLIAVLAGLAWVLAPQMVCLFCGARQKYRELPNRCSKCHRHHDDILDKLDN